MKSGSRRIFLAAACAVVFCLWGCTHLTSTYPAPDAQAPSPGAAALASIDHIIVIYEENWSFDGLYGHFPGADGTADTSVYATNQIDRANGTSIANLPDHEYNPVKYAIPTKVPPVPLTNDDNEKPHLDLRFLSDPNNESSCVVDTWLPYNLTNYIDPTNRTGDLVHRYWQEQFQINHGSNNMFMTWSDNPGLVMSYYDATYMPEGELAHKYTLCDHFFHSAFGGSFLNHQFLIAAQAPVYPNAEKLDPANITALDSNGVLVISNGQIAKGADQWLTPTNGVVFANPSLRFGKNYAVNTGYSINLANSDIWPTNVNKFLPSQNDSDPYDPVRPYIPTIGDRLDEAGISWKWYSGGWDQALANSASNPANANRLKQGNDPDFNEMFQWHHQPFAYYDNYALWKNACCNPRSAEHLQDETNFFQDVSRNRLPAVCFIKPFGADNEHPGYATLMEGQLHVAKLVAAVQNKPELWARSLIIITYDEHGGRWDHVAPPKRDVWGPGVRVPAIIISPLARTNYVDRTPYETLSILKTIEQRFGLQPLTSADAGANSLAFALGPNFISQP